MKPAEVLAWGILVAVLLAAHPYVDIGSDSDDALVISSRAILRLETPYQYKTHLGNELTPMIGWTLLNVWVAFLPVVLVNVGWSLLLRRRTTPLLVAILIIAGAKTMMQGIDYVANGCAVVVFMQAAREQ